MQTMLISESSVCAQQPWHTKEALIGNWYTPANESLATGLHLAVFFIAFLNISIHCATLLATLRSFLSREKVGYRLQFSYNYWPRKPTDTKEGSDFCGKRDLSLVTDGSYSDHSMPSFHSCRCFLSSSTNPFVWHREMILLPWGIFFVSIGCNWG